MKLLIVIFTLLGIAQFVAYLVIAISKVGIPTSISKTFYLLKQHKRSWMFQLSLICLGLFLLPGWIEASSDWSRFLCFLSAAGIMFVGSAASYLDFETGKVHIGATIIAAVASLIWTITATRLFWIIPIVCLVVATTIIIFDRKNKIFYLECAAFLSAFLSIIFMLFK